MNNLENNNLSGNAENINIGFNKTKHLLINSIVVFFTLMAVLLIKYNNFHFIYVHIFLFIIFFLSSLFLIIINKKFIFISNNKFVDIIKIFGLNKPQTRIGYRICIFYFIISCVMYILTNSNNWQYNLNNYVLKYLETNENTVNVLICPIYEELFFRGIILFLGLNILNNFNKNKSTLYTIYITAFIFWIFHAPSDINLWITSLKSFSLPISFGSFLLGIVCAFIRIKDNSIIMAIVFHILANLLGFLWSFVINNSIIYGWFYQ